MKEFQVDHFPLPGLSAQLIETVNVILSVCLFWLLVYGAVHFARMLSLYRAHHRTWWETAKYVYFTAKPEVALMTIFASMAAQRSLIAYLRHFKNHHQGSPPGWVLNNGSSILIATTITMIIGAVCWIRVVSPLPRNIAGRVWLGMVTISIIIGVWLGYF